MRISKGMLRRAEKLVKQQKRHDKLWAGERPLYRPRRVKGKVYPYASTKRLGGKASA